MWVLQWCYWVLQGCDLGLIGVLKWNCRVVTDGLQGYYIGLNGCYNSGTGVLHRCHKGGYRSVLGVLQEC